jgi:serine/threonine protein kinase
LSPLAEGGRLGRYQILRMLGAGAMGEVFLAEDPHIGRRVAIKTVKIEEGRPNEMEERKRRLERESRAAGKLLHPNVVALFDVGEDQGVLYLAFECVEGSDLAQRLEVEPPLTLREAIAYVRQAAEGLDYAHRQGVVHRDIKPSNLLISAATGTVKVSDFGIAKLKDQTSDLTMTGSVVGSPHYLSPEQIRGDELDGRSDIFSLGVLLYEVLSRRRPFQGETLTTLVYQILHRDPPSIVVDRPELGTRLEGVLQRMLQKDRDERYKTAARWHATWRSASRRSRLRFSTVQGARRRAPTDSTRRMSTSGAVQVAPGMTRRHRHRRRPRSPRRRPKCCSRRRLLHPRVRWSARQAVRAPRPPGAVPRGPVCGSSQAPWRCSSWHWSWGGSRRAAGSPRRSSPRHSSRPRRTPKPPIRTVRSPRWRR